MPSKETPPTKKGFSHALSFDGCAKGKLIWRQKEMNHRFWERVGRKQNQADAALAANEQPKPMEHNRSTFICF